MDVREVARKLMSAGDLSKTAIARVLSLNGFGGRNTGELMAFDGGESFGSLMYGSLDPHILNMKDDLEATFSQGMFEVIEVGDRDAINAGLACGGTATVAIQRVDDLLKGAINALVHKIPVGIATQFQNGLAETLIVQVLGEPEKQAVDAGNSVTYLFGISRILQSMLIQRRSSSTIEFVDGTTVHFDVIAPPSEILIVGESELAKAIASQFDLLGIGSRVVQDIDTGNAVLDGFGPNDGLILLSHDMKIGIELCIRAFRISNIYIGALGSRHTQHTRRNLLIENGVPEVKADSIFGPIGLDIGSKTPAETAVAIAAEFLAHRSGRTATSLRSGVGPING